MDRGTLLVTGGAGYIGSHVVNQLGARGERIVVLDNLSTGFRQAALYGEFVEGDTGDAALVDRVLREHAVRGVLHFAAHVVVPESVADPLKYYGNNTCKTRSLLDCCARNGVEHFVFSSTAAVYGMPDVTLVSERQPPAPINPYGASKLMSEWMLGDLGRAGGPRHVILRYFNVAGADPQGRIGQATPQATHLIKVACEAVTGKHDQVTIFGTDYPTADGTGIRDYIHVEDLAHAHLKALDYLRSGGESVTLNCGYGHGFSVRQVLEAVQQAAGTRLTIAEGPRRPGDPPALVADSARIRAVLGWEPRHDALDFIVRTALDWERQLAARPWTR